MTPKEIALAIADEYQEISELRWSIEISGLFKQNVYETFIVLWTERQDQEGNWWDVKNTYYFEEGKFNLQDYLVWRKNIITKTMAE